MIEGDPIGWIRIVFTSEQGGNFSIDPDGWFYEFKNFFLPRVQVFKLAANQVNIISPLSVPCLRIGNFKFVEEDGILKLYKYQDGGVGQVAQWQPV
jgi:hypothetical protein